MTDIQIDENFRRDRLLEAQRHAAALFAAVGESDIVRPGVRESEASEAIRELGATEFGLPEHWHKRIVRSGPNTLTTYADDPPDRTITDDDIVYVDFGPLFEHWEADFGRTFVIGTDPHKLRLRDDLATIFAAGKRYYAEHPDVTGAEMYAEFIRLVGERGWQPGNVYAGHLVGEHPHENFGGDKLESYVIAGNHQPMRRTDPHGRIGHWILEVHLVDRERQIGGFFEELLSL